MCCFLFFFVLCVDCVCCVVWCDLTLLCVVSCCCVLLCVFFCCLCWLLWFCVFDVVLNCDVVVVGCVCLCVVCRCVWVFVCVFVVGVIMVKTVVELCVMVVTFRTMNNQHTTHSMVGQTLCMLLYA